MAEPLVILNLKAENFKRLKAVEITPDGEMVYINGKNRQGKTSLLDGIWALFAGDGVVQSDPIRHGQESALLQVKLGPKGGETQFVITRKFKVAKVAKEDDAAPKKAVKKYTTELVVASPDGARFPQPQKVIDALMSKFAFDPRAFIEMPDGEKVNVLRAFVPGFDFEANERQYQTAFEDRKVVKRKAKELHAQAAGIVIPEDTPPEPIDEQSLLGELEAAGHFNTEIAQRKMRRERANENLQYTMNQSETHRQEANRLRELANEQEKMAALRDAEALELDAQLKAAPPLPDPIDTSSITALITAARSINEMVRRAKQKQSLINDAAAKDREELELDVKMDKLLQAKRDTIAAAKLPVEGMEFGVDGVTLNGVPFDQGSDEEQLSASVRIAAAMHPKLGIIRIRDGSLLDRDARKLLAEFAHENKLQVWAEVVDESSEVGFTIVDGLLEGAVAEDQAAE